MKKVNIWLAVLCSICAVLAWNYGGDLEGTEFSGGRTTGPLLHAFDLGTLLFIVAVMLSFFFRRVAAFAALSAAILCLPLYIYFTAPGPFRRIFRGEYSVPAPSNFVWNRWAVLGILAIVATTLIAFRGLWVAGRPDTQARNLTPDA